MSLTVAVQMDPIASINIDADSTFAMALEAQARGHRLYYYTPDRLAFDDGKLVARGHTLTLRREKGNHFSLGALEPIDLAAMDVVLLRQDPPFDMMYITTTHLLDHIHPKTLVVNDPTSVRNAPEKLLVTQFPDLMPPTLITRDRAAIEDFRNRHGDIIVKPLFGNGGIGVFRLKPDDANFGSLFEMFTGTSREPLMVQRYLPEITQGDKRVILIDGEPVGAINRVPQAGEVRANMHAGGRPDKSGLTERDLEICRAIGPTLRERGLIFVGIDIIGRYLTEINVTSPTGIQEINRLDGRTGDERLEAMLWKCIEAKRTLS
ncbi:glutathione synthase [Radicibacter daui]|uniref:glutathione synthase n=1 Tax=Radicibacter daui TaxID=3064829 RepID=UPI004046F50F